MGNIPQENRYTRDHEWASLDDATGIVTVGITYYAAEKLGEVVFVELPEVGAELDADEPFGIVESTKAVSDLICPLSGAVVETNDVLEESPELVSEDPFDEGWLIKVKAKNVDDFDGLMSADEYKEFVEELEEE